MNTTSEFITAPGIVAFFVTKNIFQAHVIGA